MDSSSTKQDTVAKVTGLAMTAVAAFMVEQKLPGPMAIRRPRPNGGRAIRVGLHVDDLEAWVEATSAEYVSTTTHGQPGRRSVIVKFLGKVPSPIGDVAVELYIGQRVHLLEVVRGGAA